MSATAVRRENAGVTTITLPTSTADAITAAIAARDAGWAAAEEADRTGWDRKLIDTAIAHLAETGQRFSANDLRELLPDTVRPTLMGARFGAATKAGRIRFVGYVRSTKANTHSKPVNAYVGVPGGGDS